MLTEIVNLYGTQIFGTLLLCLFGFFGMIAKRILDTPLKVQLAKIAVQFAEQTCKTLCGEEKLNAALCALCQFFQYRLLQDKTGNEVWVFIIDRNS